MSGGTIGCCCSASLLQSSSSSNFQKPCLLFETHHHRRRTLPGKSSLPTLRSSRNRFIVSAEIDYVYAEDAKRLVTTEGYKVLDVRDQSQFDRAHIKSCSHVPLFIENKDNDLGTVFIRTVHNNFSGLFFGLPFTKVNPDFPKTVRTQFSPDSKLLIVCQEGLRSTAAARKLEEMGFQNIACLTSGLQSLKSGMFESEGSTELQNAGKAGLVTVQGKISAVVGTILVCALLFVTFFPDQAEELLEKLPVG